MNTSNIKALSMELNQELDLLVEKVVIDLPIYWAIRDHVRDWNHSAHCSVNKAVRGIEGCAMENNGIPLAPGVICIYSFP